MYEWTICDPLIKDIIEKGEIKKENILQTFQKFPWKEMLEKMNDVKESEIYYSPSLEFKNTQDHSTIVFSAIQEDTDIKSKNYIFYVFYRPPGNDKRNPDELLDQSPEDAEEMLKAFLSENHSSLSDRFNSGPKKPYKEQSVSKRLLFIVMLMVLMFIVFSYLFPSWL